VTDRESILVIDDDPEVTSALREFLEREGYAVHVAHTGAEGLRLVERTPVFLVLLDLQLPDMGGIELLRAAMRLETAPDVVVVTGQATLDSAIAAVESGAAGYIQKPCDLDRLGSQIKKLVGRRRLANENRRLRAQLAERLTETEALLEISRTVSSTLDLRDALRRVCRALARLARADTVSVHLLDPDTELLRPYGAYRVPREYLSELSAITLPLREQGFYLSLWKDRRPVSSDDVGTDDRFNHDAFRRFPHQSGLLLPLVLDGEVVGAFYLVWWTTRRTFPDAELAQLEGVSGQVASFLRNARLYEQAERDRRRLEVLNDVSRRLAEVHDTDEVLKRIVDGASRLVQAEAVALRLLEGEEFVLRASTAAAAPLVSRGRVKAAESLSGLIVANDAPVLIEDLRVDARSDPAHTRGARDLGFRGFLGVPLRARGRTIGTLNVYAALPRRFLSDEVALVSTLADQASLAIEKGGLLREAEGLAERSEALAKISGLLLETLEPAQVVRQVADSVRRLLGTRAAVLYRFEPEASVLRVLAVSGEAGPGFAPGAIVPHDSGAVGYAVAGRLAVTTEDVLADSRFVLTPDMRSWIEKAGYRAVLAVPLVLDGRVIGALGAGDRAGRVFSGDELQLVRAFAGQASLAIRNAELHAEGLRRAREAEVLADLARAINSSLDINRVLQHVTEAARELCQSDMSMIALRDPASDAAIVRHRAGATTDTFLNYRVEPGKGVGGQVLATGCPFRTDDAERDPRMTHDYLVWSEEDRSRASIAVPIRIGDRLEGLLYAQHRTPRHFSDHDELVLLRLADHAGTAIHNVTLFARERDSRLVAEASGLQYRGLVEGSIQGMYIHQDSVIRFASPSMARMFGYGSPDELVGRDYRILIAPEEHARIDGYRAARLRGETAPTRYEMRGVAKDGAELRVEVLVSVLPWEGRPAVLGTFLDITERKGAEEALRRSEERYAALFREAETQRIQLEQIFASTSDGILVLGLNGGINALNRRGGELLGVASDGVVGRPFARLVETLRGAGLAETPAGRAFAALGGERPSAAAGDLDLRFPTPRTIQWQAVPMRDASGAAVGLTVTFQDVTREREVSRLKSDFVSFVTHQLRTPLAGIKWMLELASQSAGLPDETRSNVDDARAAAEQLIGLVNDMLDISRLESGKLSLALQRISLADVTRGVVEELGPLIQEKAHSCAVEGAEAAPAVVADPQLLRQAILNLVSNAIKYTPAGGRIEIRMERDGDSARWAVQDSGIGIPAVAQARLFEKFYRAENAVTLATEGTGLGLHLVRLIVDRFGGRIWCESEEGKGARFAFTLPAQT
jgi:two-component system phosphate regulon sensor histidine kinase PhoR